MIRLVALTAALTLAACQTAGISRMSGEAAQAKLPASCFLRADVGENATFEQKINGPDLFYAVRSGTISQARELGCVCNEQWRTERATTEAIDQLMKAVMTSVGWSNGGTKKDDNSKNTFIYEAQRNDMWGSLEYRGKMIVEAKCIQIVGSWGRPEEVPELLRFISTAYDVRQGRPAPTPTPTPAPTTMESRSIAVRWEGIAELMAGTVQFEDRAGTGRVAFAFPDRSATCSGTFQAKDRASGAWSLACSNGKAASGSYKALGAGQGSVGEGKDLDGKAVQFTVGARG